MRFAWTSRGYSGSGFSRSLLGRLSTRVAPVLALESTAGRELASGGFGTFSRVSTGEAGTALDSLATSTPVLIAGGITRGFIGIGFPVSGTDDTSALG